MTADRYSPRLHEIGHDESMLRALSDANVRLTYAAHRRPLVWAIVAFGGIASFYWLLSRNLLESVIFSAMFATVSTVFGVSQRGRQRFVRWSAKHPMPPSRSGAQLPIDTRCAGTG